jgi:hypothetical protein
MSIKRFAWAVVVTVLVVCGSLGHSSMSAEIKWDDPGQTAGADDFGAAVCNRQFVLLIAYQRGASVPVCEIFSEVGLPDQR